MKKFCLEILFVFQPAKNLQKDYNGNINDFDKNGFKTDYQIVIIL